VKVVGISDDQWDGLLQLLAGILHLGNIQFTEVGGKAAVKGGNGPRIDVSDKDLGGFVAHLFGTNYEELVMALTSKNVTVSNQRGSSYVRSSSSSFFLQLLLK
jgi:myosin heavy subunit